MGCPRRGRAAALRSDVSEARRQSKDVKPALNTSNSEGGLGRRRLPLGKDSAVGNFLSLLGIPQYSEQLLDRGLESLVLLSRLNDEELIIKTEGIPFLPGHRARLLRGVLVLREASLLSVQDSASKAREKALLSRLATRNQERALLQDLQAEKERRDEKLSYVQARAEVLEVQTATQAEQVRFLADQLQQYLTRPCLEDHGDEAAALELENGEERQSSQNLGRWRRRVKQLLSCERLEDLNTEEGCANACGAILSKMMLPSTDSTDDAIFWPPGRREDDVPRMPKPLEIAEFLTETWSDLSSTEVEQLGGSSFQQLVVYLLVYLERISFSTPPLHLTSRNWERLVFTLMLVAAKEHLHLQVEPDLYSKQELHGFIGLLLQHLSYTAISRPDAAHARELLEHPELASASRGEGELPNFATVPVSWAPVECSDPRMLRRPEASPHTVHGPWPDAWNLIPRRDAAMRASQPGKSAPEKVLIWRCRHPHGLFSMFSLALGHADTCERQGLGLIVDWSSSELLYRGSPGESNVWSAFFQQPADLQMTCEAVRQAIRSGRYLETTKHHAVYGRYRGVIQDYGGIPLEQAAHGRALCRRNIALQPRFQEKLEKTMASILTPGKRLAVHIRRSDKVVEAAANFELSDEKLLQRIVAQCSAWQMDGVFLCSDDASLKKRLTRALDAAGLHVSTYDATLPSEASQAAHFDKSLDSYKKAEDGGLDKLAVTLAGCGDGSFSDGQRLPWIAVNVLKRLGSCSIPQLRWLSVHNFLGSSLMPAIELTLAAIEQALSQEIQRRIDLETRIAGQVEAGLRQAARRATGALLEQLATAQRQHAEELRLRLSALERSVGSLQRQSTPKDGSPTTAPGTFERQLSWLESRITGLEQLFQKPLEMLPLEAPP
eukprot:g20879.t1